MDPLECVSVSVCWLLVSRVVGVVWIVDTKLAHAVESPNKGNKTAFQWMAEPSKDSCFCIDHQELFDSVYTFT